MSINLLKGVFTPSYMLNIHKRGTGFNTACASFTYHELEAIMRGLLWRLLWEIIDLAQLALKEVIGRKELAEDIKVSNGKLQ